jgi:hypothetical protein
MSIQPFTAFGAAVDLTEAMKDLAQDFRSYRRGTRKRREVKRLALSQQFYRDSFLRKASS